MSTTPQIEGLLGSAFEKEKRRQIAVTTARLEHTKQSFLRRPSRATEITSTKEKVAGTTTLMSSRQAVVHCHLLLSTNAPTQHAPTLEVPMSAEQPARNHKKAKVRTPK
jgi:hypothetical protein